MPEHKLRVPQARLLRALVPADPSRHRIDWPLLSRAALGEAAGYTAISGTVTRALGGIRAGSSSGPPYLGLVALGFVEEVALDVDGVRELSYRATPAGTHAYAQFLAGGGRLPPPRPADECVNTRYAKGGPTDADQPIPTTP